MSNEHIIEVARRVSERTAGQLVSYAINDLFLAFLINQKEDNSTKTRRTEITLNQPLALPYRLTSQAAAFLSELGMSQVLHLSITGTGDKDIEHTISPAVANELPRSRVGGVSAEAESSSRSFIPGASSEVFACKNKLIPANSTLMVFQDHLYTPINIFWMLFDSKAGKLQFDYYSSSDKTPEMVDKLRQAQPLVVAEFARNDLVDSLIRITKPRPK